MMTTFKGFVYWSFTYMCPCAVKGSTDQIQIEQVQVLHQYCVKVSLPFE